jgi:hypothetical protein
MTDPSQMVEFFDDFPEDLALWAEHPEVLQCVENVRAAGEGCVDGKTAKSGGYVRGAAGGNECGSGVLLPGVYTEEGKHNRIVVDVVCENDSIRENFDAERFADALFEEP